MNPDTDTGSDTDLLALFSPCDTDFPLLCLRCAEQPVEDNELAPEPEGEPERQQSNGGIGVNNIVTDLALQLLRRVTTAPGVARARAVAMTALMSMAAAVMSRIRARAMIRALSVALALPILGGPGAVLVLAVVVNHRVKDMLSSQFK